MMNHAAWKSSKEMDAKVNSPAIEKNPLEGMDSEAMERYYAGW